MRTDERRRLLFPHCSPYGHSHGHARARESYFSIFLIGLESAPRENPCKIAAWHRQKTRARIGSERTLAKARVKMTLFFLSFFSFFIGDRSLVFPFSFNVRVAA